MTASADINHKHQVHQSMQQGIFNPFADAVSNWNRFPLGQEPEQPKIEYRTPLMIAVNLADHDCVRLLLELKADAAVDVSEDQEKPLTALHYEFVKHDTIDPRPRDGITIVRTHYTVCLSLLMSVLIVFSWLSCAENVDSALVRWSFA